ncbi:MAG TPA: signal recognition particle protein [Chloroflexota bacterium]|jgi:signal recognition particle subunit SRP54|nr:signal recognition particle protein [Chloroflexota bacterium]
MFDTLTDRLQDVFKRLRGKGKLTERDVDEALREVRLALLEADVNFKVVKDFVGRVRERAVGVEVLESLSPAQQVIKIVNEELINLLGEPSRLETGGASPTLVMLVGLQGSGKTTTAAKLALQLRKSGQRPLLVAADMQRPAAVQQLITLGKQIDVPVYSEPKGDPPSICERALGRARELASSVVIFDTAGRLHVDDQLMAELYTIAYKIKPTETLLVADAMTGQDAVRVAEEFHKRLSLTGLILTKLDGDARGGAALSIRAVTGVPIKFLTMGEKLDALEPYHPDRLASRILGMGDVLSLIERAQESFDQKQAAALEKKLRTATFDLEDFLQQLQQVKKMGPLSQIMEMVPGFRNVAKQLPSEALDDRQLKRVEAIISSMTREERHDPAIIDGSRRRRIARGSGTQPHEVNQVLNQFRQVQKMMKQMTSGKGRGLPFGLFG